MSSSEIPRGYKRCTEINFGKIPQLKVPAINLEFNILIRYIKEKAAKTPHCPFPHTNMCMEPFVCPHKGRHAADISTFSHPIAACKTHSGELPDSPELIFEAFGRLPWKG